MYDAEEEQAVPKAKRVEIWIADLGLAAKVRRVLVLSVAYEGQKRAIVSYVIRTTNMRGRNTFWRSLRRDKFRECLSRVFWNRRNRRPPCWKISTTISHGRKSAGSNTYCEFWSMRRSNPGGYHRLSHEQDQKILERVMKVKYDQEVDVLRIRFSSAAVDESDEEKPGIILDYDRDGNIVGIEILNASKRMEDPRSLAYAVA
jgi:uncharacterized protein YuzE